MRWAVLMAMLALLVAPGAAPARPDLAPGPSAAAVPCKAERTKVSKFKKAMPRKRRAYYRKHRSTKQRRAYVRKQKKQLKRLQKRLKTCLDKAKPPAAPAPPATPAPGPGPAPAPPPPVLLTGDPAASALDAVGDYDGHDAVAAAEVGISSDGLRVARTKLEIAFQPDATVGQINAVLVKYAATITSMLDNVAILTVRVPDPGSVAALEAVAAAIGGEPAVREVVLAPMASKELLPPNYLETDALTTLAPLLDIRAPAAWNARALINEAARPLVIVADYFGAGPPNADLDVDFPLSANFGAPDIHGYFVAGIIGATFGGDRTNRGFVTGVFPARSRMQAVDLVDPRVPGGEIDVPTLNDRIIQTIHASNAPNIVLNTSLGHCDGATGVCLTEVNARANAVRWIERVRGTAHVTEAGAGLETRFLHATAAGNYDAPQSALDARTNSSWNAAVLITGLRTTDGRSVPNLANTMVVENVIGRGDGNGGPGLRCLNRESKRPGTISAVGTGVYSFTDPAGGTGFESGTSAAAPQVAGLAEYIWALEPSLGVDQLRALLLNTADSPPGLPGTDLECTTTTDAPRPFIDAYAAVLSLDDTVLPTPASAPFRQALLDTAGDGQFDDGDLAQHITHYFTDGVELDPLTQDFSAYDINGDGYAGGPKTAPFDLDPTGSTAHARGQLGVVTQTIEDIPVRFNERAVSDLKALCYYAYSPLYQDSPESATSNLPVERCLKLELTATVEPTIPSDRPAPLRIEASDLSARSDTGSPLPQAGIQLYFQIEGGTIEDASGITGPDGSFETNVQLLPNSQSLTLQVTARAGQDRPILASASATASAEKGNVIFESRASTVSAFASASAGSTNHDICPFTPTPQDYKTGQTALPGVWDLPLQASDSESASCDGQTSSSSASSSADFHHDGHVTDGMLVAVNDMTAHLSANANENSNPQAPVGVGANASAELESVLTVKFEVQDGIYMRCQGYVEYTPGQGEVETTIRMTVNNQQTFSLIATDYEVGPGHWTLVITHRVTAFAYSEGVNPRSMTLDPAPKTTCFRFKL